MAGSLHYKYKIIYNNNEKGLKIFYFHWEEPKGREYRMMNIE